MRFYKRTWALGTIESARRDGTFVQRFVMPKDAPPGQLMHVYAETYWPARIVVLKPSAADRRRAHVEAPRDRMRDHFRDRLRRDGGRTDARAGDGTWPAVVALVGALGLLASAVVLASRQQR